MRSSLPLAVLAADLTPHFSGDLTCVVYLYKRAQILVADLWAAFQGRGYGAFDDIDAITMFADYRVPQSLLYFGILKYSEELESALKRHELLQSGEEREVEIRGCSIWAVEVVLCPPLIAKLIRHSF